MNRKHTFPPHGPGTQRSDGAHRDVRILIGIEHPVEALALENMLRGECYRNVRVTTDVREIAPMFRHWPFNLLIVDMHSDLINSASIIEALASPITASELIVLGLTNSEAEQERRLARAAGAVDTLSRPLNWENTLPVIQRVVTAGIVDKGYF